MQPPQPGYDPTTCGSAALTTRPLWRGCFIKRLELLAHNLALCLLTIGAEIKWKMHAISRITKHLYSEAQSFSQLGNVFNYKNVGMWTLLSQAQAVFFCPVPNREELAILYLTLPCVSV